MNFFFLQYTTTEMKMKMNKIVIASLVVIAVAIGYMWWSSQSKKPAEDVTIVTPMPVAGYSIADDGFDASGLPEGLPETLSPVEPALAVQATEIPTTQPDVISAISTAAAVPETTMEGYASYAPKNWRGQIL